MNNLKPKPSVPSDRFVHEAFKVAYGKGIKSICSNFCTRYLRCSWSLFRRVTGNDDSGPSLDQKTYLAKFDGTLLQNLLAILGPLMVILDFAGGGVL